MPSAEQLLVADALPAVMRRAFNALRNGRQGPALVEIPSDLARGELGGPLVYEPVRTARSAADAADPGAVPEVARELHVHPQTVRYRLARLREHHFGATLDDPEARFELALALRGRGPGAP